MSHSIFSTHKCKAGVAVFSSMIIICVVTECLDKMTQISVETPNELLQYCALLVYIYSLEGGAPLACAQMCNFT